MQENLIYENLFTPRGIKRVNKSPHLEQYLYRAFWTLLVPWGGGQIANITDNIYNITNLYTGCTFQHKNAVINMCPVKE